MGGLIATREPHGRRLAVALLLAACCIFGAESTQALAAAADQADLATARAQTLTQHLSAYGQVEPISLVQVRVVEPGTVGGLDVVPGSVVRAGQVLARLGGPRMQALLTAREQSLRSSKAREEGASRALDIARRQYADQLATQQMLDAAQSEVAVARAAVQTADAQFREAQNLRTVRAPVGGKVIDLRAADGEQATAGETLLALQPEGKLWVRAEYYGSDAALLHVGMQGRYQPVAGGRQIAVRLTAIFPALTPDGGLRVGFMATSPIASAAWMAGEWGTLSIAGPPRHMVAVPTSALILDRGRWWVLVHTSQGDKPQQVVPGPAHGWETAIASGVLPGQKVVVTDAFLRYHRGIARSYTPPD
ncbi:MAG: efflux RND transporter periplasmic adaptor subunit [Proteobacteria bacterium]|nr:efflux RND transporter periplasmic adaptor subunit [Pseudomonadota bacterium]